MLGYGVSVLVLPGVVVWKEFIISDWVGWSLLFFLGLIPLVSLETKAKPSNAELLNDGYFVGDKIF